jgi:hypothetical protein
MKSTILTDAGTKLKVLVVFGAGGCVFAKPESDADGEYTELYNEAKEVIVSVLENPESIQIALRASL